MTRSYILPEPLGLEILVFLSKKRDEIEALIRAVHNLEQVPPPSPPPQPQPDDAPGTGA